MSPTHRKSSTIHKRIEVLVLVSVWHLNKLGIQFILHPHYTLLLLFLTANKCTNVCLPCCPGCSLGSRFSSSCCGCYWWRRACRLLYTPSGERTASHAGDEAGRRRTGKGQTGNYYTVDPLKDLEEESLLKTSVSWYCLYPTKVFSPACKFHLFRFRYMLAPPFCPPIHEARADDADTVDKHETIVPLYCPQVCQRGWPGSNG